MSPPPTLAPAPAGAGTNVASARRVLALGLVLLAVCWPLNWALPGLRTHLLFFPLWLGYVFVVEGWTQLRSGTSLLARSTRQFVGLFFLSIPVWWLFEAFNIRLANWDYLGREEFSDLEYAVLCSVSFATVMPAVLGTAELVGGMGWMRRFARGPRVPVTRGLLVGSFVVGWTTLIAMLVFPKVMYPFVWVSGVLILEPVAHALGRRSLLTGLSRGDWRPWMALWVGSLVCGFFWEFWNMWSYPKWIYHVPFVGFLKVFEMPLLGYLGYLPFAMELYLVRELLMPEERTPAWMRDPADDGAPAPGDAADASAAA